MFLYHQWTQLPINTRIAIAKQFGILKKGSTEVVDNQIKSDGYNIKEIEEALNVDALQTYLSTDESDMTKLWERLVEKTNDPVAYEAKYRKEIEQPIIVAIEENNALIERLEPKRGATLRDELDNPMERTPKKKGGRPKKNA